MLTAITYNCSPDTLGGVAEPDFVDAFENAVRSNPAYRDLAVSVTFEPALRSDVTRWAWAGGTCDDLSEDVREWFRGAADGAWEACLAAG